MLSSEHLKLNHFPLQAAATEPFAEQAKVTNDTNFFATLDACQVLFPLLRPHARSANNDSNFLKVLFFNIFMSIFILKF